LLVFAIVAVVLLAFALGAGVNAKSVAPAAVSQQKHIDSGILARLAYLQMIVATQATQGSVSDAKFLGLFGGLLLIFGNLAWPFYDPATRSILPWHFAASALLGVALFLTLVSLGLPRSKTLVPDDPLTLLADAPVEADILGTTGLLQAAAQHNELSLTGKERLMRTVMAFGIAGAMLGGIILTTPAMR
jgi:hypothetical protein